MSTEATAHFLDNLPAFHTRLLEYGARPYWSPDGKRIHHAPWRTSNSDVSLDGRWLAFMTNKRTVVSGTARRPGLMDLAAWNASAAKQH